MAINIKNYVDISTTFPSADAAGRSFGGLVFTTTAALPQPEDDILQEAYEAYEGGGVTYLTLGEVKSLFGSDSDEYKFAVGYYGYISPSGRFASRLAYSKVMEGEKPIEAFDRVNALTNLFGSFTFLSLAGGGGSSTVVTDTDIEQLREVAAYNSGLDAKYLFVVNRVRGKLSAKEVTDECALFAGVRGTVYVSGATAISAYMPMAIFGSTDYATGSVVNYMFKQFGTESPTVMDDSTYTKFNQAYVNFYGRTQTNGQTLDFYQRGFNTDGTDTAVYCNEVWFKSQCETSLMNLLVSRERVPADQTGVALVSLRVTECCSDALQNGMFMAKDASAEDMRTIREIIARSDGDVAIVDDIDTSISVNGYYVYAYLDKITNAEKLGRNAEYVIIYYVFYGTADSIRYIKGNNVLIK